MRVIADFLVRRGGAAEESTSAACPSASEDRAVTRIYQANADFVWRSLQRLGVRDADLDDVLQEVFVVVHQRLHTFDGTAKMTRSLACASAPGSAVISISTGSATSGR